MAFDTNELPPAAREFISYKLVIQGRSPKTVEEYCFDLRTFFRYIKAVRCGIPTDGEEFDKIDVSDLTLDDIKMITPSDIYEFFLYVDKTRENGASAKSRKLSAIRAFFKYLTNKKCVLETDPSANIDSPKKKASLPKYLTLEESKRLLDTVKGDLTSKTRVRDFCIISVFLNTGMRLSELVGISFGDIDRELRSVRVLGKGNKERIIYINDACRAALADYYAVRLSEPTKKPNEKAFFLSGRGQRISVKTVEWMVKKYLSMAGLGDRELSTHKLRHTAATLMYQEGHVDVRVLKDILGHAQLNTTQIYTHLSNDSMQEAMASNPLADYGKEKRDGNED
ncbi:MAG: tyrosine recombinase XerC [Firmicutes bacterium]|nr:tyrosine recombinase XerC [Bacillota bacterium]